jgi:hypothetical protein
MKDKVSSIIIHLLCKQPLMSCIYCIGVPNYLRGKEFIFRNASHLHVSEFQTLVVNHLKAIVNEGVEVKMVQDTNIPSDVQDSKFAYLIMNSVRLVMNKGNAANFTGSSASKYNNINTGRLSANSKPQVNYNSVVNYSSFVESFNQVNVFQYSVPFTQDGTRAHAKKIDEQWIRLIVLTVKEPFPYILTRQQVISREIKIFSPIEVSTTDIEDRIESMETEINLEKSDHNNLMRLVQGTVLPQVSSYYLKLLRITECYKCAMSGECWCRGSC